MTYLNPLAKWQNLAADYIGEDISRMHYSTAKEFLNEHGVALVFANTVRTHSGKTVYIAIIECNYDWIGFVTEAAGAWRKNVERFTLQIKGKQQIESLLVYGIGWSGSKIGQREAIEIASVAMFTREQGQEVT